MLTWVRLPNLVHQHRSWKLLRNETIIAGRQQYPLLGLILSYWGEYWKYIPRLQRGDTVAFGKNLFKMQLGCFLLKSCRLMNVNPMTFLRRSLLRLYSMASSYTLSLSLSSLFSTLSPYWIDRRISDAREASSLTWSTIWAVRYSMQWIGKSGFEILLSCLLQMTEIWSRGIQKLKLMARTEFTVHTLYVMGTQPTDKRIMILQCLILNIQ